MSTDKKYAVDKIPQHIAIIMDGNGRWAKKKFLPRTAGHIAGSQNFKKIVRHASALGVRFLTLYVFSTENWTRPADEVAGIMNLLLEYLKDCLENFVNENIHINFIGDLSAFSDEINELVKKVELISANKTGMTLNLAINYGGKAEIVYAAKKIANSVKQGQLQIDAIDINLFSNYLYTAGQPDVDLLIRTGGDMRISNFLLWQVAYAEIYVSDKMWPDFLNADLERAIKGFSDRERRFGGLVHER